MALTPITETLARLQRARAVWAGHALDADGRMRWQGHCRCTACDMAAELGWFDRPTRPDHNIDYPNP